LAHFRYSNGSFRLLNHKKLLRGASIDSDLQPTILRNRNPVLLHEIMPSPAVVAVLINPDFRDAEKELNELQPAAMAFGQKLLILKASTAPEIQASFMTLVKEH
jgi:hypothetical protein